MDTLKKLKNWVSWRYETVDGKPTKRPLGSSTDGSTWNTYLNIKSKSSEKMGIGFVFPLNKTILGIDLDHCISKAFGKVDQENADTVNEFLKKANTYVEYSPSGTGLHVFLQVKEPLDLVANKKDFGEYAYECYTSKRFFTVTEKPFGVNKPVRSVSVEEALSILSTLGYPWKKEEVTMNPLPQYQEIDDAELMAKMLASTHGGKINALFNGNLTNYNSDDSAADMALCNHLAFWTGGNATQMERLWGFSALGKREKFNRKDYRDRTIKRAIANCKEFYKPPIIAKAITVSNTPVVQPPVEGAMTFGELMSREFPKARYVLEPFFEQGTINMISAPPNTWKSWLLFFFASHIAKGTKVFDNMPTEQSKVMIVNEEDSFRAIQERFKILKITDTKLPLFFHVAKGFKIDQKFVDNLIKEAKEKDIGVIFLDSLRAMHQANENDSTEMQVIMDHLKTIARAGITVIFTHHHRKKNPFSKGDDAEASRGSTAINAAISGHISLEEEERETGLYIIVRHLKSKAGEKKKPFEIKIVTDRDKFGIATGISFIDGGEFKTKERKVMLTKDTILSMIPDGVWKGVRDFVETGVAGDSVVRMALKILQDEKMIISITRKEAIEKGIKVYSDGKANEKLYSVNTEKVITNKELMDNF